MSKDLEDLRERKKELLLESDINRQIISLEVSQVKIKAVEWRKGLAKAGAIYKFAAPLTGVVVGLLAARKQIGKANARAKAAERNGHRNGNGHGLPGMAALIAPLGMGLAKQALAMWREKRKRDAYGAAE